MRPLYEIDEQFQRLADLHNGRLVDTATGEIIDEAEMEALKMERSRKIRNIACLVKNLRAEARMLKEEEDKLSSRRKAAEREAEKWKGYLAACLHGEKAKGREYSIYYKPSESVAVDDIDAIPAEFIKETREAMKDSIRSAIRFGREVPGAHIEKKMGIVVA